ncbi:unnamed protein product [Arctogadus glacialis]
MPKRSWSKATTSGVDISCQSTMCARSVLPPTSTSRCQSILAPPPAASQSSLHLLRSVHPPSTLHSPPPTASLSSLHLLLPVSPRSTSCGQSILPPPSTPHLLLPVYPHSTLQLLLPVQLLSQSIKVG